MLIVHFQTLENPIFNNIILYEKLVYVRKEFVVRDKEYKNPLTDKISKVKLGMKTFERAKEDF